MLNIYGDKLIAITSKILKDYLAEFQCAVKNNSLGPGYKKSLLYYMAKTSILQQKDLVNMKVPEWLLNTMCAVWNSGIGVIYAKNPIGDKNYPNANTHGLNSSVILEYLPKLVNE